jgi:hypothetical protein
MGSKATVAMVPQFHPCRPEWGAMRGYYFVCVQTCISCLLARPGFDKFLGPPLPPFPLDGASANGAAILA